MQHDQHTGHGDHNLYHRFAGMIVLSFISGHSGISVGKRIGTCHERAAATRASRAARGADGAPAPSARSWSDAPMASKRALARRPARV